MITYSILTIRIACYFLFIFFVDSFNWFTSHKVLSFTNACTVNSFLPPFSEEDSGNKGSNRNQSTWNRDSNTWGRAQSAWCWRLVDQRWGQDKVRNKLPRHSPGKEACPDTVQSQEGRCWNYCLPSRGSPYLRQTDCHRSVLPALAAVRVLLHQSL